MHCCAVWWSVGGGWVVGGGWWVGQGGVLTITHTHSLTLTRSKPQNPTLNHSLTHSLTHCGTCRALGTGAAALTHAHSLTHSVDQDESLRVTVKE